MAARAKKEEKNIAAIELAEEAEEAPTAVQHHKIVTTYTKTVPVEEEEQIDLNDSDPAEPAAEVERDPIEELLRAIGSSPSTWTLVVDRLPHYHKDGAAHTRVKYSRCGAMQLTAELLQGENYIEEIQTRWARPGRPNDFRLIVRKDNRIHSYLPVLSIEPPDPEVIAKQTAYESPQINVTMPQNENSFDSFLKQAEKMARLRDAMGWTAPQTAQNPGTSNEPLTTERALLHLVAQDGDVIDGFTSKLKSVLRRGDGGGREISWMDIMFEAIKANTLPNMIREAKSLLMETTNGQTQMGAPQSPMGAQGWHAGSQSELPQTDPAPSAENPAIDQTRNHSGQAIPPPEIQLLQFAVTACAQNADIKDAAARIESFESLNPTVSPYLNAFVEMPAPAALQWLAGSVPQAAQIAQMPHAHEWVSALQSELKNDEESDVAGGDIP